MINVQKRILIIIPSYDWNVRPEVLEKVENFERPEGFSCELNIVTRKLIHAARNTAIKDMLVGGFDYLLMCDDDNAPKHNNALKLLIDARVDIVSGCIRKRSFPNHLAFHKEIIDKESGFFEFEDYETMPQSEGLFEVGNVGTGFVLYKRAILERLYKKYDYCPFENKLSHFAPLTNGYRCEFERAHESGEQIKVAQDGSLQVMRQHLSEDLLFHRRAKQLGVRLWVHCGVLLDHYGNDWQIFKI